MNRLTRFFTLLVVLSSTVSASAQVPTGTPKFGSYGGGPDTINLANLNGHLTIPVLHKSGRGIDFAYDLTYDSSVWLRVTSGSTVSWKPMSNWGWAGGLSGAGIVGYISYDTTYLAECFTISGGQIFVNQYNNFIYHDSWGILHPLAGQIVAGSMNLGPSYTYGCPTMNYSIYGTTTDGAGLTYSVSTTPQTYNRISAGTVYTPAGGVLTPALGGPAGSATLVDRNGNEITQDGAGHFYDTLSSATATLTLAGSGTPSSPITFTYAAPSGASAPYTVKYAAYTVQTKFLCNGIPDYGPIGNNLVSEIDLPDGSKYSFTYEGTPGVSGNVTGRVASIVLPTGGTITYGYTGGNAGINCSDGSAATLTRTTPDGTWTYAQVKGSGAASTTTITDPQGNVTTDNFSGIYLTQSAIKQGSSTLLQTILNCYNAVFSNCATATVAPPIRQLDRYRYFPNLANPGVSQFFYNSYGLMTQDTELDYVPTVGINPYLVDTQITYASLGSIVSFPQQVTVRNNAGSIVSQTSYNYDETAVATTSGTPQHVAVSGSRGNLTSIHYPAGSLTSHFAYNDTGTINAATDVNGAVTTNSYSGASCGNSFPTSVSEPLSMSRSMTWNCTGGVQTSITDENGKTVTTAYSTDAYFWRPNSVTDQAGAQTTYYYQPNPTYCCPWEIASNLTFNNGNSQVTHYKYLDGLGRTFVDQSYDFAAGSLDSTSYAFDANGRLSSTSMPCLAGWANGCPSSTPKTTQTYDALNRPLVTTDGGGGTVTNTYSQNDVLVTVGPNPTGENTKRRNLEYDALGRLTSVCEITNATGSGPCGQHVAYTGFLTTYTYDALNNLVSVAQGSQARSFVHDAMSRLTSETNPESGTTTYTYDVIPSGCWAGGTAQPGDLTRKQDAAGNTLCITYDALHRPTGMGPSSVPPCRRFSYDKTSNGVVPLPSGVTVNNAMGRLVEAETDNCGNWPPIPITDEWFSYTPRGETSDVYASTPHSGGYYRSSLSYWANGAPNVLTTSSGYYITYNVDGEGRPYKVLDYSGGALVNNTTYNPSSLPTAVTYGSGDNDSFTYDPYSNRMMQYKFTVGSSPQLLTGNLTWNANGTLQTQNISDAFNVANTQNCSYGYDDLVRLTSANCGTAAAQTFSYDPFGNISKSGSPYSFQPGYSTSTNHIASLPGCTPTYDLVGNLTNDCTHTYAWDNYGLPLSVDSVNLTYDALGRMVEQNRSGAYTQFVYSPTGFKMQVMNGQTATKLLVPLPAGGEAMYLASGVYLYHSDHLGSSRFASSYSNRTMYFDTAYAPFGEPYAQSGTADPSFTGQRQDTVAGLYDFPAREYSYQGRWSSPDPAGLAAVNPANPQSWNRYAYVMNNPLNSVDPLGLTDCIDGHFGCNCDQPDGDCTNDFYGSRNPGNGCAISDITCGGGSTNSDKEISQDIAAENPFSSTVANALSQAQADFYQSIIDSDILYAKRNGDQIIIINCTGSINDPLCFPLFPGILAPGSSPYSAVFSPYEKYRINKIVNSTRADQLADQVVTLFGNPMTACEYASFAAVTGGTLTFPFGGPLAGTVAGRIVSSASYTFGGAKALGLVCH
jgi:RHS repeat-associated protein